MVKHAGFPTSDDVHSVGSTIRDVALVLCGGMDIANFSDSSKQALSAKEYAVASVK